MGAHQGKSIQHLGHEREIAQFAPMEFIPSGSDLTIYDSLNISQTSLDAMFTFIRADKIKPPIAAVFSLDEIALAHGLMDSNTAGGKIVVRVE